MDYDFKRVADAALDRIDTLLSHWFPAGKKRGVEYVIGNLSGDAGSSLSINTRTGVWCDFSTDQKGADLVSLYAAINNFNQAESCKALAETLGISAYVQPPNSSVSVSSTITANKPAKSSKSSKSPWEVILPVPANHKPTPVAHPVRGKYQTSWAYCDLNGDLLGYVCRFDLDDGKKDIIPLVYAQDTSRNPMVQDWRWRQFPEPRPMYGLNRLANNTLPVLLVEGEKCADAGHYFLRQYYAVLSWPGGGKAVNKVDWSHLKGHKVVIWPDCDSHTKPNSTEYIHKEQQAGWKTALAIAKQLHGMGIEVHIMDVPVPGKKKDGWDIVDAIEDGLVLETMLEYIHQVTLPFPLGKPAFRSASPISSKNGPVAGSNNVNAPESDWRDRLLFSAKGQIEDCMQNIATLIDNLPEFNEAIKYSALTGRIQSCAELPWDAKTTERDWRDSDDLELMDYLSRQYNYLFRSTNKVMEAVKMVAERHEHNPLVEWLSGLEWDGRDRLTDWLHTYLGVESDEYSRLVGPMWMRQAVYRGLCPGAKADHVLILEGRQGLRKSSALRALGGDWFSDAPMDVHSKDLYQVINGIWIYEIAELDMFNRADATSIKAFITRGVDRYRVPYGKYVVDQKRFTVFAGTTNASEYFKDMTGNRRFWPVACTAIDIDALTQDREQLFAQALHELKQGYAYYPTDEERVTLIEPAQAEREIPDAWQMKIEAWLSAKMNDHVTQLTMLKILEDIIGLDISKVTSTRQQEAKIGAIMLRLGWVKKRRSKPQNGTRGYYYEKGAVC